MRNSSQKLADTWDELAIWNQFGLAFVGAVALLCCGLQILA